MKPKFTNLFRAATAVISITTAAHAQTLVDWNGSASSEWNNGANWNGGAVPTKVPGNQHARVNTNTGNIATISASITPPVDIFVGDGAGANGRLDHTAGVASTGAGNWMFVGRNGGTGVYNLADTNGTGGTFTNFATGDGSLYVVGGTDARLYIGGQTGSGSTGTVNVNTLGFINVGSQLQIGTNNSTGTLNIDAGAVTSQNWTEIGNGTGCTGNLNMSGGSLIKSGANHIIVGANGATGNADIRGGKLESNNQFWVANNLGSKGTLSLSGTGEVACANAFVVGRGTGAGGFGKLLMSGGTINKTGANNFSIGDAGDSGTSGGIGQAEVSGGTINANNEFWVGNGTNSNGTLDFSAGTINIGSWVAIGRNGGKGTVKMSGGTWNKTGDSNFIVGASGSGITSTMEHSGGTVTVAPSGTANRGITWIGEGNGVTGVLKLSGSATFTTARMTLGEAGGSTGIVELNGGTLRIGQLTGGAGSASVAFNGTQVIATAAQGAFIDNLDFATVGDGGVLIDTQAFHLATAQPLAAAGTGGLVKSGSGTLTLTGANSYSGPTVVNAGTLSVTSASTGGGAYSIADTARLVVNVPLLNQQLVTSGLTLGTTAGSSLAINLLDSAAVTTSPAIDVNGDLALNGPTPIDVSIASPAVASYPLISFDSTSGSGAFQLGTLSRGLQGSLVTTPNLVSLNITRAANLAWDGTAAGQEWNTSATNWYNFFTASGSASYANGDPVTFDDLAATTDVILNTTVTPSIVDFVNASVPYTLSGSGKISGAASLNKLGNGLVTISTVNDYTGPTTLTAGTLAVASLPNGGTPGPIGASTAAPENLRFNGGSLLYTGPAAATDRGFSIIGLNSSINTAADLTFSGRVAATAGQFSKLGTGNLALTHSGETPNTFGGSGNPALRVDQGTLTFDGSSGTQLNTINGEVWVGSASDAGANLTLTNTTVNVSSWLAVSRINGTSNHIANLSLTDSVLTTGNFSSGYAAGAIDQVSQTHVTLTDSSWSNSGNTNLAESIGNTTTVTLNGASTYTAGARIFIGQAAGTTASLTLNGTSQLIQTNGWFAVGNSGTGTLTITDNASYNHTGVGDFNVADLANSTGTLNLSGNGAITADNSYVGKAAGATGVVHQTGGTFNTAGDVVVQIGMNGTGTWNLSGGSVATDGWVSVGRFAPGNGTLNVSAGSFTQADANRGLLIGEDGTGILSISGSGRVESRATSEIGFALGWNATGNGTVNLNGGTLLTNRLRKGAGYGELHFDGGTLQANENANPDFMNGLNLATIRAAGAFIDTNGKSITIAQLLEQGTTTGGGLTKSGPGTLTLTAANSYTGPTTITAGTLAINGVQSLAQGLTSVAAAATLAGNGVIGGSVTSLGTLAPGVSTGTLTVAGDATLAAGSALTIEIDESQTPIRDTLAVGGKLTIAPGASLNIILTGAATQLPYTIATFDSIDGQFTNVTPGTTLVYNANSIVVTAVAPTQSPAEAWIAGFFPGETDPAIIGLDADPDGDGSSNLLEFALNGDPQNPSNNGTAHVITADSSAPGSEHDLVITLAVRKTAPTFVGTPSPTSTVDGISYSIEGSLTLADAFNSPVSPVDPITTGLPSLPENSNYEYRSFRLDASNGLTNRGFLRVRVSAD